MKVRYEESFLKDLRKLKDERVKQKVRSIITNIKSASDLESLSGVKKLKSDRNAYRIRIGDYRLGFYLENDTVDFARFTNRKNIYKKFPK
ncbi:type II toxin-antitoxin system RelE family toxin [Tunicatimonas sp.]|uniref:type II toxin-antitoxin system RelE family toxin n=1 Tax=Tunicatimonas sp. TaxID=1940096 RepID=UPI003C727293